MIAGQTLYLAAPLWFGHHWSNNDSIFHDFQDLREEKVNRETNKTFAKATYDLSTQPKAMPIYKIGQASQVSRRAAMTVIGQFRQFHFIGCAKEVS